MQEDFLHYIWKFQKFLKTSLSTQNNEVIEIVNQGSHNFDSGPDFFSAQIRIGEQLWVGNVEIHLKSSDWYSHHHENDPAYDNVILHVVFEHDVEVYRKDNTIIPTLELKNRIENSTLSSYNKLFSGKKNWIPCEDSFEEVDDFVLQNWLERMYFERLENKSSLIFNLLENSKNDWESVLFKMLAKNFGLKNNGQAFLSIAQSFDFSVLRKVQKNQLQTEALLFGQAGLLETDVDDDYFQKLKNEYAFLKNKFQLENRDVTPVQFFRLRPANFPTIRMAQLAQVYFKNNQLFSKILAANNKNEIYKIFNVNASSFWDTHYHFNSVSPFRKKTLSKSFVDLLIINTFIPVIFCFNKQLGVEISEHLFVIMSSIESEENNLIKKFNTLKPVAKNALHSQALIEMKTSYCDKKKCMQCGVGIDLLKKK